MAATSCGWILTTENLRCVNAEDRDNEFLWYGQRLGPLAGTYTMYVTTNRAPGTRLLRSTEA